MKLSFPKIIWAYWHSKKIPSNILRFIKTWKVNNPDYEIRILNERTIDKWLPGLGLKKLKRANDFKARLSDFVRINLMYEYGGIWMDASILSTMSFTKWFKMLEKTKKFQNRTNIEYVGYSIDLFNTNKKYPIIENWFFVCKRHSKFMKAWRDEFMSVNNYDSVDDYLEHVEGDLGVDFQEIDNPHYLTMHISAQVVLQNYKYPQKNLLLFKADEGPLKFILHNSKTGYYSSTLRRIERLCRDENMWAVPFVKITGREREILDEEPRLMDCIFDKAERIKNSMNN
jgi:hypothetical protein